MELYERMVFSILCPALYVSRIALTVHVLFSCFYGFDICRFFRPCVLLPLRISLAYSIASMTILLHFRLHFLISAVPFIIPHSQQLQFPLLIHVCQNIMSSTHRYNHRCLRACCLMELKELLTHFTIV